MAHKRLEAAILAGHNIGVGDYADFPKYNVANFSNIGAAVNKVTLPLDRWGIYSVKYSKDGSELAVGFGNGGICLVDHKLGIKVHDVIHGHRKGLAVMALHYVADNYLVSAGANGKINLWELNRAASTDFEPRCVIHEENNEISSLDVCQDGSYFASVGKDRNIRLYDVKTFQLHRTILAPDYVNMDEVSIYTGHTKRIFAVRFHPDENHLFLTAGWDDCVKLWDKRMPRSAKRSIAGPHVCGAALDVAGNTVLTGSWSAKNALQLWDLRSGGLDKTLPFPHDEKSEGEFLYCAKFASGSGGPVLAGGSGTNSACAVHAGNGRLLASVQSCKPVLTLDSANAGKQFAVAGIGGNLQLTSVA